MIQTSRLTLRLMREDDADWIAREIARPEVHQWLTSPPCPYRVQDALGYITRVSEDPGYRLIEHTGRPRGVISITPKQGDGADFELGFWLAKTAWGQGIMTEAASAMIDRHFHDHDALASGWMVGNCGSENVHHKLGFTETGETRPIWSHFHGCDMPVIRVRLDRARWAKVNRGHATADAETSGEERRNT